MALDNAQFISELSITDPPGTDPLSEGDDQIRTSKRTQQQSFPNVDAAVTITAAQMNDMAFQSAVNTFTANNIFDVGQTFNSNLLFQQQNPASIQGLQWKEDTTLNTLWQWVMDTADIIRLRRFVGGSQVDNPISVDPSTGVTTFVNPIRAADGLVTAPAYSFTDNTNMGMYREGSGALGVAVGGTRILRITTGSLTVAPVIFGNDGTAAAPAYSFGSNINTGMYRSALNEISFATAAVRRFLVSSTGSTTFGQAQIDALTDTVADLRYLRAGENRWQVRMANESGFTVNNLQFRRFDLSGVFQDVPFELDLERGQIIMAELPTNASGLFAGMLWRNGNVVNIV